MESGMLRAWTSSIAVLALVLGACTPFTGGKDDLQEIPYSTNALQDAAQYDAGASNLFSYGTVTDYQGIPNGGLIGPEIGENLSPQSRARAVAAEYKALEYSRPDTPVYWRNAVTGNHGTVVAGDNYQVNALDCRSITHTVFIGGRKKVASGSACRRLDRTWRIIG